MNNFAIDSIVGLLTEPEIDDEAFEPLMIGGIVPLS